MPVGGMAETRLVLALAGGNHHPKDVHPARSGQTPTGFSMLVYNTMHTKYILFDGCFLLQCPQ